MQSEKSGVKIDPTLVIQGLRPVQICWTMLTFFVKVHVLYSTYILRGLYCTRTSTLMMQNIYKKYRWR